METDVDDSHHEGHEKQNCGYFFKKLDTEILKPLLIYKYNRQQMHMEDDFLEYLMNDENILGSIYGKMDPEVLKVADDKERVTMAMSRIIEKQHLSISQKHDVRG